MKTKSLKNKKKKHLIVLDIIVVILCIIISDISLKNNTFTGVFIGYLKLSTELNIDIFTTIIICILLLFTEFLNIVMKNYLIIIIYLSFRIIRGKVIKENKKYEIINNIEYFRDLLVGLTPSEISLITDLEIESKKDIVASMLDLYQRKIIDFENNKIIIIKEDNSLRKSEIKLLSLIKCGKFNNDEIKNWKKICINEAINDNLIQPNKSLKNIEGKFLTLKTFAIVLLICTLMYGIIYFNNPENEKNIDSIDKQIELMEEYKKTEKKSELSLALENEQFAKLYIKFLSKIVPILLSGIGMLTSILILCAIPIYKSCRNKINKTMSANKYERTKKGKILVEEIDGIKNYIHDFSLLSEKEKDSIIIWNEFLIYAIVLEENTKIIDDISKYTNLNNILTTFNDIIGF